MLHRLSSLWAGRPRADRTSARSLARSPARTSLGGAWLVWMVVQWLAMACALALWLADAAQAAPAADPGEPPARVGYPSLLQGTVEISWDGGEHWERATHGAPITAHTALRTQAQSRAELRVGAHTLRMGAQSELLFEQLDDQQLALQLRQGRVNLRVPSQAAADRVQLAVTPGVAGGSDALRFVPTSAGWYHLDTDPQRQRALAGVLEGAATVQLGPRPQALPAGQQVAADLRRASLAPPAAAERHPVDDWAEKRDLLTEVRAERQAERGNALPALPALPVGLLGVDLLVGHGVWRNDTRFGAAWFPRAVGNDWAPYREGRWAWVPPWGWTWVDDAPWGFAPFHYGRWAFLGGRWGWLPGQAGVRAVYAPALVGFYGSPAGGWGVPLTDNVVGWYPLGPGEAYRPVLAQAAPSAGYVQALNAPHLAGAALAAAVRPEPGAQNHRYAQTSFAATVMPQTAFRSGDAVATARLDVPPHALAGARALGSSGWPTAGRVTASRPATTAAAAAEPRDRPPVEAAAGTNAAAPAAGIAAGRATERANESAAAAAVGREAGLRDLKARRAAMNEQQGGRAAMNEKKGERAAMNEKKGERAAMNEKKGERAALRQERQIRRAQRAGPLNGQGAGQP